MQDILLDKTSGIKKSVSINHSIEAIAIEEFRWIAFNKTKISRKIWKIITFEQIIDKKSS